MRRSLLILLALLLPFQAAFAATTALSEAIEHAEHAGHHGHADQHDHGDDMSSGDILEHANDHNHSHSHPVFSPLLPVLVSLNLPVTDGAPDVAPAKTLPSTPPTRLERPPRPAPVA
jgi:ABC-type nickel/cobalt efflux system permease component RcnA